MIFSSQDLNEIEKRGSDARLVAEQFARFEQGFSPAKLDRPATCGDGIIQLSETEIDNYLNTFEQKKANFKLCKFVPASGAASRMFKKLFELKEAKSPSDEEKKLGLDFLTQLPQYALYNDLEKTMAAHGHDLQQIIKDGNYPLAIHYLLEEEGLNYGHKPKGALLFHRYPEQNEMRTPIAEHLVEAALYARNIDNHCYLHFTVSPQHQVLFEQIVKELKPAYEARFGVTYEISYSIQDPATDTLAATMDNLPYHDANGHLLFRPGGHGALIYNLQQIQGDIIFIKNIDNVITEDKIAPTVNYKKVLAAYLMEKMELCHQYLRQLEERGLGDETLINEIKDFAKRHLHIDIHSADEIFPKLNRPMRVCGMVRNEGAPGGGPFWVTDSSGETSLQIVESSQIDFNDAAQKSIAERATHFNPVDLVCSTRNYQGNAFNLPEFIDPDTGFISYKSDGDKQLKAMELPGLWNGAMAHWITLFIEVPLATFNPVKTIFDLLKR